jgi:hypothetical protein
MRDSFLFPIVLCTVALGCAARGEQGKPRAASEVTVRPVHTATVSPRTMSTSAAPTTTSSIATVSATRVDPAVSSNSAQSLLGKTVRVRLRRDVLGVPGTDLADDTARAKAFHVEGLLERIAPDAIVLHNGQRVIWVPAGNVLLIETVP